MIVAGLAAGLVPTIAGMVTAFNAANETGRVDQATLSQAVATGMKWTQVGLCVAAAGVVLWFVSRRTKVI
jgi:biopolymer transport protein ExbB/TolQ